MSGPERIGIPDGVATNGRNQDCPGALLVVTRDEYGEMRRGGLVWSSGIDDIPADGKGHARVLCHRPVQSVKRPHGTYLMGLCAQCGEMEANQRKDLRARAK